MGTKAPSLWASLAYSTKPKKKRSVAKILQYNKTKTKKNESDRELIRRTLVATSMKSTPMVLLTNGNDRDARRLHSITMQSVPFAMNWMLNGPVMFSLFATALVASY